MTLHIGPERHDEFNNGYFPIMDENDETVGTAYDKKTADLFAAAGEMLEVLESFGKMIVEQSDSGGAEIFVPNDRRKALALAVQKGNGGHP